MTAVGHVLRRWPPVAGAAVRKLSCEIPARPIVPPPRQVAKRPELTVIGSADHLAGGL